MPGIALTQGMGSLAQDIAEKLADELQLSTLQHEVAEHVANKMHVSKSLINRLRAGKAGTIERLRADREAIAVYTAQDVIQAAARAATSWCVAGAPPCCCGRCRMCPASASCGRSPSACSG